MPDASDAFSVSSAVLAVCALCVALVARPPASVGVCVWCALAMALAPTLVCGREDAFAWCESLVATQLLVGNASGGLQRFPGDGACVEAIRVLLSPEEQERLFRWTCSSSTGMNAAIRFFGSPPYHFLGGSSVPDLDAHAFAPSRCNLVPQRTSHVPSMQYFGPGHLIDECGRLYLAMRAHADAGDRSLAEQLLDPAAIGASFDFAVRLRLARRAERVFAEGRTFPEVGEVLRLQTVRALRRARVVASPQPVLVGLSVIRALHRVDRAAVARFECRVCALP